MDILIKYLLLACFAYVYVRLLIPYIGFFTRFMFNERVGWDKYIEKPRLVFYGLGLALMHGSYSTFFERIEILPQLFYTLNWFVFICGIALTLLTWTKKFKNVFIPKIKEKLKSRRNFNISITEDQLKNIYNSLVRYDMIICERTEIDDFMKVFKEDWNAHDSKIYFKLDAPSCREFFELFKVNFPKNSLTVIDFFKRSDTIRREDGNPYTYSTVKDAKSRTPISKKSNELQSIFYNL
ncbi:hypothetical protein [Maribacter sp. 2210JD10-5]|uniref:hypothetical protein n=1 Tax=Maribacter sp. 2210JD10-5 TaxID=3386272 RepID=UPI0039BD0D6B